MLAFDGERYLGQLYLQEYDSTFREPGRWHGERPWADFHVADPLGLQGRFLTLGCYHVGWMPGNRRDSSLYSRGIGTALLRAVIRWYRTQQGIEGLLSWALVPGSIKLLSDAGQMPYTVYRKMGFLEIQQVHDPHWTDAVTSYEIPDALGEDPTVLRVMLLRED